MIECNANLKYFCKPEYTIMKLETTDYHSKGTSTTNHNLNRTKKLPKPFQKHNYTNTDERDARAVDIIRFSPPPSLDVPSRQ